jgi:hypothetical protein
MNFGEKVLEFYANLAAPKMPRGIAVMNPHVDPVVRVYVEAFCRKFYDDNNKRILVFGINPGRFGAGLTGITFTDPVALAKFCGIPNKLIQKRELSAEFIYQFIDHWGGVTKFYQEFFLTAVSPLGFVKNGINYNYYDDPQLLDRVTDFIVGSIHKQVNIAGRVDAAILLGSGKNKKVFEQLNKKHNFFKKVYTLDHPRFIMQYRRKQIPEYLQKYRDIFAQAVGK